MVIRDAKRAAVSLACSVAVGVLSSITQFETGRATTTKVRLLRSRYERMVGDFPAWLDAGQLPEQVAPEILSFDSPQLQNLPERLVP